MNKLSNDRFQPVVAYAGLTLYAVLSPHPNNSAVVDEHKNLYCGNCRSREGDGWHCRSCGVWVCARCRPVGRACLDCTDLG